MEGKRKVGVNSGGKEKGCSLLFVSCKRVFSVSLPLLSLSPHLDVDALRVDLRAERLDVDEVGRDRQRVGVEGEAGRAELFFFFPFVLDVVRRSVF